MWTRCCCSRADGAPSSRSEYKRLTIDDRAGRRAGELSLQAEVPAVKCFVVCLCFQEEVFVPESPAKKTQEREDKAKVSDYTESG